jgi:hypothetical protein
MSEVKVNKISPRTNCGTVQLGDSGDTITIPAGATIVNNGTQTGFGRTGTVNWNTTAITADPANAVSGTGYFANTTSAAFTITLPTSPSAGDIVAVRDYAQTFATNNLTIGRNGQPIDGLSIDLVLSTNGAAVTLVYVDGTQGWKSVNSNETFNEQLFVAATGGTVTCCGDYKIHTFTGPGTFTVTCAGNPAGSTSVDYLVVAGGGGGGSSHGAGGGAGGYRESSGTASGCYTASPLGACVSALPVTAQGYPIVVGGGGAFSPHPCGSKGVNGSNSVFSSITSTAGGGGGRGCSPSQKDGAPGGSGGGGGTGAPGTCFGAFGSGNTPPVSPPQGNNGAIGSSNAVTFRGGGGGGGATAAGTASPNPTELSNNGGAGATSSINGTPTARAGGGGGASSNSPGAGAGGAGGGGTGGYNCTPSPARNGTTNTGGGGGGSGGVASDVGGAGGSGIVIIRYKFQ